MSGERGSGPGDGVVVVDKPAGMTSHDVVGRVRRIARTRRVGHAGTLDPMATGVLVLGVGRATRLLGHLALAEKEYEATIRLGATTVTDDVEGEVVSRADPADVDAVTEERLHAGVAALTGEILQVPSSVSAIKVDGERAYKRVRGGETVELPARPVTVHAFRVRRIRREPGLVELDASVTCSSGTYVRALARDLGAGLGVGGHLTALRRTRVGPYTLAAAHTLEQLVEEFAVVPIGEAAAAAFPRRVLTEQEARVVGHGGQLATAGLGPGPVAAFAPDGTFLALLEEGGGRARPLAVFVG